MPIYMFVAAGIASFYSLPGNTMADGRLFDPSAHVCAMIAEPFGERVKIENTDNGLTSWCIVSDRGPFVPGRVIDVSPIVRSELDFDGLANVVVYKRVGTMPNCINTPSPITCKNPPPKPCVLDLPKPALVKCP